MIPRALMRVTLAFLGASVMASMAAPYPVDAEAEISGLSVENEFPDRLVFKATISADAELERVELHYQALPDGTDAIGRPEFSAGKTATVEFVLKTNDPPRAYFPAGTTIRYFWEAEDASGAVARTEPETYLYLDTRFEWTPVEGERITIFYHSGSRSFAEKLAQIGDESLAATGQLLGTSVPFPVRVFLYTDPEEMKPALQRRSERFSELVTTGGTRVASDTVFVAKGFADTEDTLRHELAHIVTKVAGEGAFGDLPAWLDEGVAVFAQGEPGRGYQGAIEDAIDRDRVLSIHAIAVNADDPGLVDLFYGQSWSLVTFLVEQHGQEKFAALFREFKSGATPDEALRTAYGFDSAGLENEWRHANGLAPRELASPTATAAGPDGTPVATLTPFVIGGTATPAGTVPAPSPTSDLSPASPTSAAPEGQSEDGGSAAVLIAAIAAAAAVVLATGVVVAVRRRRPS